MDSVWPRLLVRNRRIRSRHPRNVATFPNHTAWNVREIAIVATLMGFLFAPRSVLSATALGCPAVNVLSIGGTNIKQLQVGRGNPFFYKAGMNIDADGAPNAYHPPPQENLGLDYLGNAGKAAKNGKPANWWALATDTCEPSGQPIVQGPGDPSPGYYISMTSLQDSTHKGVSPLPKCANPLRYVDSTQIPYIVLPSKVKSKLGAKLGDFAVVINGDSHSPAIFADVGPPGKIGEGSISLAKALGLPFDPKHSSTSSGVIYLVFPGSGNGKPRDINEIKSQANNLFSSFGGFSHINACFPL